MQINTSCLKETSHHQSNKEVVSPSSKRRTEECNKCKFLESELKRLKELYKTKDTEQCNPLKDDRSNTFTGTAETETDSPDDVTLTELLLYDGGTDMNRKYLKHIKKMYEKNLKDMQSQIEQLYDEEMKTR